MMHLATNGDGTGCTRGWGIYTQWIEDEIHSARNACGELVNLMSEWLIKLPKLRGYTTPGRLLTKAYTGCQVRRRKFASATVVAVDGLMHIREASPQIKQPDENPTSSQTEDAFCLVFESEDVIRGTSMMSPLISNWGTMVMQTWVEGFSPHELGRQKVPTTWVTLKRVPLEIRH